ncbi:MAG: hypothetical protein SGARI_005366, partial [Bacillariaceae sp.]
MASRLIDDMELLGADDSASVKPTTVDQLTDATSLTSSFESLPVPPISPLVVDKKHEKEATDTLQQNQTEDILRSLPQETKHQPATVPSIDEDEMIFPLKNSEVSKMKAAPPMSFAHLAPPSSKNAPKSFAHLAPNKAAAANGGGGSLRRAVTAGAVLGGGSTCYAATADPLGVHPLASTSKNRQRQRQGRKMHSSFSELSMFGGLEPPSALAPSTEKRVDFAPFSLKRASTVSTPSKTDTLKQAAKSPDRKLPSFASMKPPANATSSLPRRAVSVGVTATPGVWNVP